MSIPRKRSPAWKVHPGEILREEYLKPMKLSATALAKALHVSVPTVNDIVRERRAISAEMAVRLSKYFRTTAQFWLNLQASYEVTCAREKLAREISRIHPSTHSALSI